MRDDKWVKQRMVAMAALLSIALLTSACEQRRVIAQSGDGAVRQEHIAFGELPSVTTAHDGFMWVLDRRGEKIGKIDPATNEVVEGRGAYRAPADVRGRI
jgi:streptogramin lyase